MSRMARYAEYRSDEERPSPRSRAAVEPVDGAAGTARAVSVGLGVAPLGLPAGAGVTMRLPPEQPPPTWGGHAANTETEITVRARMRCRGTCTATRACG